MCIAILSQRRVNILEQLIKFAHIDGATKVWLPLKTLINPIFNGNCFNFPHQRRIVGTGRIFYLHDIK